jgi:aspartyl/asparaginyl beta-hydroxylase (cupin superfamily)
VTRHIWVPQRPLEKLNHTMAAWINHHMPALPLQGEEAIARFPELKGLQQNHEAIKAELLEILKFGRHIPDLKTIHPRDARISSPEWRNYVMRLFGHDIGMNSARCPETTRSAGSIPGVHTFLFSILSPHSAIPAHRGWAAGVVRIHYPLIVPHDAERCFIAIEGKRYNWREGEPLLFDDTRRHEVVNETEHLRAVLIIDFEPRLPLVPRTYCAARYRAMRRSEEVRHMLDAAPVRTEGVTQ